MQLAQLNIGRFKGGPDDPRMADFLANVERINALGESMPGFVARVTENSPWADDHGMAVNMSVWESAETLEKFVWQTIHVEIYNRKAEFFEKHEKPHLVMWWVESGQLPTLAEAKARLDHLIAHGPSEYAFGWAELPSAKLWQEERCA